MIVIGDLDLLAHGTTHMIVPTVAMSTSKSKIIRGETLTKVVGSPDVSLTILGHFSDSAAGISDYKKLMSMILSGNVFILKHSKIDDSDPLYSFIRLISRRTEFPAGHMLYYYVECVDGPAWGRTTVHTGTSIQVLDPNYLKAYDEIISPIWHDCSWLLDQTSKYFEYVFYLRNDYASGQDAILEIQAPDNLSNVKVYYSNGTSYTLIGDWGGADAWGATKNFTDPQSVAHDMIVNKITRGGTLSGLATASLRLGCNNRIMMKITGLSSNDAGGADSKTKYGKDQLLLKVKVTYSNEETTWID